MEAIITILGCMQLKFSTGQKGQVLMVVVVEEGIHPNMVLVVVEALVMEDVVVVEIGLSGSVLIVKSLDTLRIIVRTNMKTIVY